MAHGWKPEGNLGQSFLCTMWVPGIDLGLSVLAASAFSRWAVAAADAVAVLCKVVEHTFSKSVWSGIVRLCSFNSSVGRWVGQKSDIGTLEVRLNWNLGIL